MRSLFKQVNSTLYKKNHSICENVKAWCETQPDSVCTSVCGLIRESQVIFRKVPSTIESKVPQKFLGKLQYVTPEKYLVCIRGAKLVGADGLVILPDGGYVQELAYSKAHLEAMPTYNKYGIFSLPKPLEKYGLYYSLLKLWSSSGNYYHWIHDVLQQLYLVIDLLPKDIQYIVPSKLSRLQYDSLRSIGISDCQFCYFSGNEVWKLDSLFFSPPTATSGHDCPGANEWVRDLFYSKFGITRLDNSYRTKRIFISRRLAKKGRRVTNERAVQDCLLKYNFQTYLLEEMSLQEQIALFSQAEAVVCSHGAGLTNLIFAPPGTHVLEIFEPSTIGSTCYWSLSECLGHNYWFFLGKTIRNFRGVPNIFVPVDKLTQTLEKMFG